VVWAVPPTASGFCPYVGCKNPPAWLERSRPSSTPNSRLARPSRLRRWCRSPFGLDHHAPVGADAEPHAEGRESPRKGFTEPVTLSSTVPADFPPSALRLLRTAFRDDFDL